MSSIFEQTNKIPIVIGVTGHRNIVKQDYADIYDETRKKLAEIKTLCKLTEENPQQGTPVVLLTGLAEGADMLVTKVAKSLNIPYIAVLPCKIEQYRKSFDDVDALRELDEYIGDASEVIVVDDIENDLANQQNQSHDNYMYRQVGIYIAQHSSLLLALWDGSPPTSKYGGGTSCVVNLALNHSFVKRQTGPHFGMAGDCAVLWIRCRREGDGSEKQVTSSYLLPSVYYSELTQHDDGDTLLTLDSEGKYKYLQTTKLPDVTADIIKRTVEYNEIEVDTDSTNSDYWLLEQTEFSQTSDYQQRLHRHYLKADALSGTQKRKFVNAVWWFAVLGMLVAMLFMLYDESGWNFLSLLCGVVVVVIVVRYLCLRPTKRHYHRKFLAWRALSETLRTQFYVSVCGIDYNVCDGFTWLQKNDMVWIDRAVASLSVGKIENKQIDLAKVKDKWIGTGAERVSDGQYGYHAVKSVKNGASAQKHNNWSTALLVSTLSLYGIIFVAELLTILGWIDWFDVSVGNSEFTVRKIFQILFGVLTAVSFLITASLGKLSFSRQQRDNARMKNLYFIALDKWESDAHFEQMILTLAREEIVENGIWLSYMVDNNLEITV